MPCLPCCSPARAALRPAAAAGHYWLFHSVWHILLAEGYHLLYLQLEGLHLQQTGAAGAEAGARKGRRCRPAAAGHLSAGYAPDSPLASSLEDSTSPLGSSLEDSASSSEMEGDGEEQGLLSSSGGALEEEDSDASLEEPGEVPPPPSAAAAPSGGAAAGFVYALLQPAARLMRYQRQQQRLERRRRRAASARKDL